MARKKGEAQQAMKTEQTAPENTKTTRKAAKQPAKAAKAAQQPAKSAGTGTKKPRMTPAEWQKIEAEYLMGRTSLKKLAEKYQISLSTLKKKASIARWKEKRNLTGTLVEPKILLRACDARTREFEAIARATDNLGEALDGIVGFITQNPPEKYEDLRGLESLARAIDQIAKTKRDLYNIPNDTDRTKIQSLREKNRLEREKWTTEQEEKAKGRKTAEDTVFKVMIMGDPEGGAMDE